MQVTQVHTPECQIALETARQDGSDIAPYEEEVRRISREAVLVDSLLLAAASGGDTKFICRRLRAVTGPQDPGPGNFSPPTGSPMLAIA